MVWVVNLSTGVSLDGVDRESVDWEHCDVLSMQMDSDLVIYRTTLVQTFQMVTIYRVDKSEVLVVLSTRNVLGEWVYLVTLAMSLFDLQDVCIAIGSLATLDLPMVVDLIGIYVLKGPYCTLTTTNWFLQALSVIPMGSWRDVARRFTMPPKPKSQPPPLHNVTHAVARRPPPPIVAARRRAIGLVPISFRGTNNAQQNRSTQSVDICSRILAANRSLNALLTSCASSQLLIVMTSSLLLIASSRIYADVITADSRFLFASIQQLISSTSEHYSLLLNCSSSILLQ
ncbi:hypothetical protein F511_23970 [Dorcoceras hygrometricum]|uniref:Uncharacterized protein n=1 Tax=Dorcoceras hygrometricum TaxID=472368 RepID=A0A2Z7APX8_9LAMI|nr:hypothetical protein F511_23970 [Dorcoceras hygrometricum]